MGESRLCVQQWVGLCRTSYDSHPAGSQPPPPRGIFEVFHSDKDAQQQASEETTPTRQGCRS